MRAQVSRMFGANQAMDNLEAMTRKNMELFGNAMRMFSPFTPGGQQANDVSEDSEGGRDELGALKDQLADMQRQLNKLSRDG